MSELDDFLRWGSQYDKRPGAVDRFGRRITHNTDKFPYGTIAGWIAGYRADKGVQ